MNGNIDENSNFGTNLKLCPFYFVLKQYNIFLYLENVIIW